MAKSSDEDEPKSKRSTILQGESNFPAWKKAIMLKLMSKDLWGVASGRIISPNAPPAANQAGVVISTLPMEEWVSLDNKAWGIIGSSLAAHVQQRFVDETRYPTAFSLFEAVRNEYQSINDSNLIFQTFLELFTSWTGDSIESAEKHVGHISELFDRMANFSTPIPDQLKPLFLLRSLPQTDRWITFVDQRNGAVADGNYLRWDDTERRFLAEVRRRTETTAESALASKAGPSKPNRSDQREKKFNCSLHGKNPTHNSDQCFTLKKQKGKEAETAKREDSEEKGHAVKDKRRRTKKRQAAPSSSSSSDSSSDDEAHHVTTKLSKRIALLCFGASESESDSSNEHIILDSGASTHMVPNKHWFIEGTYKLFTTPRRVRFGNASHCEAIGTGSLLAVSSRGVEFTIEDALHVPSFTVSLISVGKLTRNGATCLFHDDYALIQRDNKTIAKARLRNKLYELSISFHKDLDRALTSIDINTLHRRLGHTNHEDLKEMVAKGHVKGITRLSGKPEFCEPCVLGKMKKQPFPRSLNEVGSRPLRAVVSDVGGPVSPTSRGGHKYWITFMDVYSRYSWIYFMKSKSEALEIYRTWRRDVQSYFGTKIGSFILTKDFLDFFRSDNGGEYIGWKFEEELRQDGVIHETTASYTPEQNGLAERLNQTLVNTSTATLIESGLPRSFWAESMSCANHTRNHSPTSGAKGKSPYQELTRRKVDASLLRPFGVAAYPLIPKEKRDGKHSPKAEKCVLLGYVVGKKAYRLLSLKDRRIIHSRHVKFNENEFPGLKAFPAHLEQWGVKNFRRAADRSRISDDSSDDDDTPRAVGAVPAAGVQGARQAPAAMGGIEPQEPEIDTPDPIVDQMRPPTPPRPNRPDPPVPQPANVIGGVRRTARARVPNNRNRDYDRTVAEHQARLNANRARQADERERGRTREGSNEHQLEEDDDNEIHFAGIADTGPRPEGAPKSYKEALRSEDSDAWQRALADELRSLKENDVYEEVPIPKGIRPVTSKVVLKIKYDANGKIERHKCRLVARGFVQREGVDYNEIFAPVANLDSIRILLALAAKHDLELDQMDVNTAFLDGELQEEVYLMPPDDIPIREGYCWKLKRALYGLKQASRTWNKTLDRKLGSLGFTRLDAETCLYVFKGDRGELCFLVVYVDDLLLAATSRQFMNRIKRMLSKSFKMRDLGAATFILGIEIKRDRRRRTISLSQQQYVDTVLRRCGMADCSPVWTPMTTSAKITATDPNDDSTHLEATINGVTVSYPSIVGSLMYAALATRPDLSFVVGVLGRFSAAPKSVHWEMAKHALRYLKGTRDMVLQFDGSDLSMDMDFHGYSDADWAGDVDSSRSTSGYAFISNRGAVSWSSKRQGMVALSTTESEYIGLSNAGQHLAWLRTFFEDIGHPQQEPTILNCDNQAAIILTKDPQFRARTKHIQRKFHFVRDDLVAKGEAVVRYVPTDDMVADIFTKALPHEKHWTFARAMGLRLRPSEGMKWGA